MLFRPVDSNVGKEEKKKDRSEIPRNCKEEEEEEERKRKTAFEFYRGEIKESITPESGLVRTRLRICGFVKMWFIATVNICASYGQPAIWEQMF